MVRRGWGTARKKRDRKTLKREIFGLLAGAEPLTQESARKRLRCGRTLFYECLEELVKKDKALRPLRGTRPLVYTISRDHSLYEFNGLHQDPIRPVTEGDGQPPPEPPRPPMLAEAETLREPARVELANLQWTAEIVRSPDPEEPHWYGSGDDWKAAGWDQGWSASGVKFRVKVVKSDYGHIPVKFAFGPRRRSVTISLDRQTEIHAAGLVEKDAWYDDFAQGVLRHLAKGTGYGFGYLRRVAQEEWIHPLAGLVDFEGGPFQITAADGEEIRIDRSRGPPELQVKSPKARQAAELMEGLRAIPDLVREVRGLGPRFDPLESGMVQLIELGKAQVEMLRRLTSLQERLLEALGLVAGTEAKGEGKSPPPDDRRGYM